MTSAVVCSNILSLYRNATRTHAQRCLGVTTCRVHVHCVHNVRNNCKQTVTRKFFFEYQLPPLYAHCNVHMSCTAHSKHIFVFCIKHKCVLENIECCRSVLHVYIGILLVFQIHVLNSDVFSLLNCIYIPASVEADAQCYTMRI